LFLLAFAADHRKFISMRLWLDRQRL
jgi:hypothetical protein